MISSLKRALQPSVTDLKAEFKLAAGGYEILQAPAKLPTIFNGDKAVVYGIVRSAGKKALDSAVEGTATLRGMILGQTIEYSIPFRIPQPVSEEETGPLAMPMVHHLAAKNLLKDWEAGEAVEQLKSPTKEAIIKLSIDSSVVSAHTAYVAVDEDQDEPIEGAIQTWDVAAVMAQQEMGHGYHFAGGGGGHGGAFGGGGHALVRKKRKTAAFSGPPPSKQLATQAYEQRMTLVHESVQRCGSLPPPSHNIAMTSCYNYMPSADSYGGPPVRMMGGLPQRLGIKIPSDKLSALISLQQAEGLWQLDATLAGVFSKSLPELEGACPVGCQGDVRRVWATVLALAYLEACLSGQREEWELVATKAEFWLEGQSLPAGTTLQALKEAARMFL